MSVFRNPPRGKLHARVFSFGGECLGGLELSVAPAETAEPATLAQRFLRHWDAEHGSGSAYRLEWDSEAEAVLYGGSPLRPVAPEPKFLFASPSRDYATVVTMAGVADAGTPVCPEDSEDEGDDCEYLYRVADDVPAGDVGDPARVERE